MKYQQTEGPDCYRYCIATLLGIDAIHVPPCFGGEHYNLEEQLTWLKDNYNLTLLEHKMLPQSVYPMAEGAYCILTGPSPRDPKYQHTVIGRTLPPKDYNLFCVVFDPHPSCDSLVQINTITWLIPLGEYPWHLQDLLRRN